jgi:hypothetical protein
MFSSSLYRLFYYCDCVYHSDCDDVDATCDSHGFDATLDGPLVDGDEPAPATGVVVVEQSVRAIVCLCVLTPFNSQETQLQRRHRRLPRTSLIRC